jgi:hypothetical protein
LLSYKISLPLTLTLSPQAGRGDCGDDIFILYICKPLTLTLSPQVGRGDWKEFLFYSKEKNCDIYFKNY